VRLWLVITCVRQQYIFLKGHSSLLVIIMLGIQELNQLSVREILWVCGFEAFTVPLKIRKNKLQLLELIISSAPSPVVSTLTTLVQQRNNNR